MIFIGSESRGYFAEEFATKKGLTFAYVEQSGHISDQVNDILEHGTQDFMIFDAEQYIDTASDLASEIKSDLCYQQCQAYHLCPRLYERF